MSDEEVHQIIMNRLDSQAEDIQALKKMFESLMTLKYKIIGIVIGCISFVSFLGGIVSTIAII